MLTRRKSDHKAGINGHRRKNLANQRHTPVVIVIDRAVEDLKLCTILFGRTLAKIHDIDSNFVLLELTTKTLELGLGRRDRRADEDDNALLLALILAVSQSELVKK